MNALRSGFLTYKLEFPGRFNCPGHRIGSGVALGLNPDTEALLESQRNVNGSDYLLRLIYKIPNPQSGYGNKDHRERPVKVF